MQVIGRIRMIDVAKQVSPTFITRDVVVTTEETYPQHISIQFTQDKCALLDTFQPGENVSIGINLRGREWINPQGETKYFNSIQGWNISRTAQNQPQYQPPAHQPQPAFPPPPNQHGFNNANGYPQQQTGYNQPQQGYGQQPPQQNPFGQPQNGFPPQQNGFPPAPNFSQQQEAEDDLPF